MLDIPERPGYILSMANKTDRYEPGNDDSILTSRGRKNIVDEMFFDKFGHYPGETKAVPITVTPAPISSTSGISIDEDGKMDILF